MLTSGFTPASCYDTWQIPYLAVMEVRDLVDRVRQSIGERNRVIHELYMNKTLRDLTHRFVHKNGGTKDDAETIFTDAIVVFVKNCHRLDFQVKTDLPNYFYGVTKNLWYRTFRNKRGYDLVDQLPEEATQVTPESLLEQEELSEMLRQMLDKLDTKCREVLRLWALNMAMKSIAEKVQMRSAGAARKKKHQCLHKLINIIEDRPDYARYLKKRS